MRATRTSSHILLVEHSSTCRPTRTIHCWREHQTTIPLYMGMTNKQGQPRGSSLPPQVILRQPREDVIHRHHLVVLDRLHPLHHQEQLHEGRAHLLVAVVNQVLHALFWGGQRRSRQTDGPAHRRIDSEAPPCARAERQQRRRSTTPPLPPPPSQHLLFYFCRSTVYSQAAWT